MKRAPPRRRVSAVACAACGACMAVAGCADFARSPGGAAQRAGAARAPTGEAVAPQAAREAIAVGRSTRGDVLRELGRAIVVSFDSGYEVWIYRWPGADRTTRTATELVVLFAPSGVVKKVRLRPGE